MAHILNLRQLKILRDKTSTQQPSLSWEAEEYEYVPKPWYWFGALALTALAAGGTAAIFQNYFLSAFIVIAGFLIGWFAQKKPRKINFAITSEGVRLDRRLYVFDDLKSFWVFYDPPLFKELSLESKRTFMPYLKVPLGGQSPEKVRELLLGFLPEEKQDESFIAMLSRLVGF